ncbi:sulfatase-like hydrolase/transferase [Sphingobacterium sp. UT-1RO-CII-1]|uniref:LTA synthase family protein n=1 Tax=Sphingobacterium sp. UT-1RO-CII-1 TaxID=2995225 RepID=UPI00227B4E23|nr:alkaline phosphatase family protein [Sphingobacterium sp. UT-1RO-CII-1]MCY4779717.1 sulfatase-like hydrolase/transferase [Sphingobacterium sp. UT-1RO-CII-1]
MKLNCEWRTNIRFFLALFFYWVFLSVLDRTVFLFGVWHKIETKTDVVLAFLYGLKLDFSLASYLLVLPLLFYVIQHLFVRRAVSTWVLRIYVMVITFILAFITVGNVALYESWGEKISKRAIVLGLDTLGGVSSSIDGAVLWKAFAVLCIFFLGAHYFYHWFVVKFAKYRKQTYVSTIIMLLVGAIALFTMIRGGYGRATLNQSSVYFSDDNTANHVAVNTYWSFIKDLTKSTKKSPYKFMALIDAENIVENEILTVADDSVYQVLVTKRPNVILVILEGLVGQIFEDLGGEKDVTPKMKELMDEGVSFRRAYAAADRSDKGMIAVLAGFPAQGPESIIKYIPKHERLPAIGQVFDSCGYATSFYHGGQSEFYNFKSFMFTHGIDKVVDNINFPIGTLRSSWGVYDHVVADRMFIDLKKEKKPFFSIFYTLVNHEPFNLSTGYKFGNNTKADAYRSTSFYTDSMLYSFIDKVKRESWYENTIIIVTSDHGHVYPTEKYGLDRPERYHVPLFFLGGALKEEYRGLKVDQVVSQLDIVATLSDFIGGNGSAFKYSQNLFAKNRKNIAFYNSNGAFGLINDQYAVSYDMLKRNISYTTVPKENIGVRDSLLNQAKAYYQVVFDDFLKY